MDRGGTGTTGAIAHGGLPAPHRPPGAGTGAKGHAPGTRSGSASAAASVRAREPSRISVVAMSA